MKLFLGLILAFSFSANAYITPLYMNANQLQGRNISAVAPTSGQTLSWNSSDSAWTPAAGGGGSGDVVGPGSATDNGFVKFDGTSGKLIKNSAATIANADVNASAGIVYSKLSLTGGIVNADVNSSAAITYSKLALTGGIVNADVNASAGIVYSKLNLGTSIVNADISGSAAIAYSKLNLGTSIVNADVSGSAAIAYSKLNLGTSIVNADVSTSAAIAYSKLANLTAAHILVGSGGNVPTDVAVSGDISMSNAGVTAYVGTVPPTKGGTGLTSYTTGDIPYATATNVLGKLSVGAHADGEVVTLVGGVPAYAAAAGGSVPVSGQDIQNCTVKASVSGNALLLEIKQADGTTDPASGSGACNITFKNATASTTTITRVSVTGATTFTVSSGSTLNCTSAVDCYLFPTAINNAGTVELGVIMGAALDEGVLQTSVAEGGAGAADSELTLYSTTARSAKAVRGLARIQIQEATAGTWASAPTSVSNYPYELLAWSYEATIGGCNPNLAQDTQTDLPIESSSCTMTTAAGFNRMPMWIGCSSTNPPTGPATCGAGNESISGSFILPNANGGTVMVCFNGQIGVNAGGSNQDFIEVVETGTANQTISQHSKIRFSIDWRLATTYTFGGGTCGTMSFNSGGRKMLRAFQTTQISGTPGQNQWITDNNPTRWTVYPVNN